MFNWIKGLFGKKEPNWEELDFATITFHITGEGSMKMSCKWLAETELLAELLGELFFHVNNGDMKEYCVKSLQTNTDEKNEPFIGLVMDSWNMCEYEYNNKPCISPLDALKTGIITDEEVPPQ